jgi:hypothetical protein
MTLHSVVAQITFDTEEFPNLDGIADLIANWEGVRRVRLRPAGQPNAAATLRSTAQSRFADLYTEQQFQEHEEAVAEAERGATVELTPAELNLVGVNNPPSAVLSEPAPGPASGPSEPLPPDAKPSRAKRA